VVGVDSEFFPHNNPSAVIVQVATRSTAMVFDLFYVPCIALLANLFRNPTVIKLGQAFQGDMQVLHRSNSEFDRFEAMVDTTKLFFMLFPHSDLQQIGLARLTALFLAKRLCKREQMSNWSLRPLTTSQLHYAALDALVLIDLVDLMRTHPSFPTHATLHSLTSRGDVQSIVRPQTLLGFP